MKIRDLPLGVGLDHLEDEDFVTLVWTSDQIGARMPNPPGVAHEHVTRCVTGRVRFTFRDDGSEVVLNAGQEVMLPVGRGYVVTVEAPCEVRCFYPKAVPGAVEAIEHLRVTIDPEASPQMASAVDTAP